MLYAFLFSTFVLHAPLISSFLTWLLKLYLETSTSYETSHYAVFSNLLPLLPSLVQIFFSNTLSLRSSLNVRD
jgi:hypothetical protein